MCRLLPLKSISPYAMTDIFSCCIFSADNKKPGHLNFSFCSLDDSKCYRSDSKMYKQTKQKFSMVLPDWKVQRAIIRTGGMGLLSRGS